MNKQTAKPGEQSCPVLPLALEFDALVRAYDEQDRLSASDRIDRHQMIIWDRMAAIREQASYLRSNSNLGAAFQIMQANIHMDVLTDSEGAEQRMMEAQMVRLFYRAVEYLMHGENRIRDARQFSMGEHINPFLFLKAAKQKWGVR